MRKQVLLAVCVPALGLAANPVFADDASGSCSLATLHGTYAFAGTAQNPTETYAYSSSGMESYDGKGHLTWYQIWTDTSGTYTYSGTGTYTFTSLTDTSSGVPVTASCVAKVTYTGYSSWTYFVPPDGNAYFYNDQRPSRLSGGKVERVSMALLVK